MSTAGFNVGKFHLVGHSLGAHLVGQIGRTTKFSPMKLVLPRISGLDPAGPAFYPLSPYLYPLNAQDAKFVDIIHTDVVAFGGNIATGHADFWPNGPMLQPGCPPLDYSSVEIISSNCTKYCLVP